MTSESKPTLASLLEGTNFAAMYTDTAKSNLTKLLDEQQSIIDIPNFVTTLPHESYCSVREHIVTSATLATILGDARLEDLLQQWTKLQQGYARQVIADLRSSVKDQQKSLDYLDQQLQAGEPERQEYDRLSTIAVGKLGLEQFQKVGQLKARMKELDETAQKREQLHRSISGVSKAEQQLTTLIDSSTESIHYLIQSAKETLEGLATKTYDGPTFAPFAISRTTTINDIFSRSTEIPSLIRNDKQRTFDVDDLPQVLSELTAIYQQITAQKPGTTIVPTKIIDHLGLKEIQARGLGSYLEENAAIFGVMKRDNAGSRTFTRQETGSTLDKQGFLDYMLSDRLQQHDKHAVNDFYLHKALGLLREQPTAYEGFTTEHVVRIAENQSLPVGKMYIARNLKKEDVKCIKPARNQNDNDVYVFADIIPTTRQVEYTHEAVQELGHNRFELKEIVRRVTEIHHDYRILPAVAEKVLTDNEEEWELRKICDDPVTYQKNVAPEDKNKKKVKPAKDQYLM